MNTKIKLSEEISTKIIMVDKDAKDDLSRHYLDFDIVVVDNFMSHEEIMILQDSQISNNKNSDIGKEHKMDELHEKAKSDFK